MEEECNPQVQVLPPLAAAEVQDVEEGEISDSTSASSLEEITEEDFNKHDHQPPVSAAAVTAGDLPPPKAIIVNPENNCTNNNPSNNNLNLNYNNHGSNNCINSNNTSSNQQQPRVWTMRDLYEYQISRNYSRGVHNLAWASWASAVKSKPSDLPKPSDEVVVMELPKTTSDSVSLKQDGSPENGGSATVAASLKRDGSPENCRSSTVGGSLKLDGSPECGGSVNVGGILKRDGSPEDSGFGTVGGSLKQDGSPENSGGENKGAKVVIEINEEKIKGLEEKEDGELEEGEIDLESDGVNVDGSEFNASEVKADYLELRANSVLKGLETAGGGYAEKSFNEVYSLVEDLLESLQELADEISLAKKEDLIRLLFTAIQTLHTVFSAISQNQKNQMRERVKRFVASLMTHKLSFLSAEQLKEMEVIVSSMDSLTVSMSPEALERNNGIPVIDGFAKISVDICSEYSTSYLVDDPVVDAIPMDISDDSEAGETVENSGVVEVSSKYRGLSLPLLDLHKDHDADSLPSPTREAPSNLPIDKGVEIGRGNLKPEWPIPRISLKSDASALHPYESDAVKAVSAYQQKFGRSSFFMNDRLPSPTPSEDGDTADGGDVSGEVSSSLRNVNPMSSSGVERPGFLLTPKVDNPSRQVFKSAWSSAPMSLGQNLQVKPSLARNRDPRLRLVNSDAASCNSVFPNEPKAEPALGLSSSRKQKTFEEPVIGQPALKKPRNELVEPQTVHNGQTMTGAAGWLDGGGMAGLQMASRKPEFGNGPRKPGNTVTVVNSSSIMPSVTVNVNDNLPVVVPHSTVSLQSLLKEIAVNPSVWMNLIKMDQQKSAPPTKSATQPTNLASAMGSVTLMTSVTPKSSVVIKGLSGTHQGQALTTPPEESGIMRMKPRDPRRILHSNTLPKGVGGADNQFLGKTSTISGLGRVSFLNEQRHEDQLEKKSIPTPSTAGPDITSQFTKNLKNIADLVSVSQSTSSQSLLPQIPASQQLESFQGRSDSKGASDFIQTGPELASKEVCTVSSQPQNNWGDLEHLFDGFDDQQKAAIQRERARRMEEQRKMFAARKLCLVLDLDHTLLNSAKFAELDPVHDEILRKKEEEEREKPQRHLFRFPHMGMWTKLRPGIWNFLERASKLYELHLYTMGNKLYATEMAKLLDPKGDLFAGRVISRGDDGDPFDGDERVPKSKDLDGVLGMESAVVIIDDSVRVWPHNKLNLIVVERYIYFPCSRRQFGLLGPSLLEIDHDERLEDGTLASSLAVIERIHFNFFSHQSLHEADVRNILASEQRKILAGCRVVFSRVFPVGEVNPQLHPLWQTAEQFGAVCINSIDEQVTHVVANSLGTDKVNWGLSTGRFVVHPGWVEASALLYRRANEHDFAIKQ